MGTIFSFSKALWNNYDLYLRDAKSQKLGNLLQIAQFLLMARTQSPILRTLNHCSVCCSAVPSSMWIHRLLCISTKEFISSTEVVTEVNIIQWLSSWTPAFTHSFNELYRIPTDDYRTPKCVRHLVMEIDLTMHVPTFQSAQDPATLAATHNPSQLPVWPVLLLVFMS